MNPTKQKRLIASLACTAGILAASPAFAYSPGIPIPLSAKVADSPSGAGTGLAGAYWNANVNSNGQADSLFATTASGTFLSPTQDYGSHGWVNDSYYTVQNYLQGGGASHLAGDFTANLDTATYRFTGYINITSDLDLLPGGSIDVNFAVGSDDGMRLIIGGQTVTEANYARAFAWSSGMASFAAPGLYAIELVYWENYGGTGLDFQWQTNGNAYADVATGNLYPSLPSRKFR